MCTRVLGTWRKIPKRYAELSEIYHLIPMVVRAHHFGDRVERTKLMCFGAKKVRQQRFHPTLQHNFLNIILLHQCIHTCVNTCMHSHTHTHVCTHTYISTFMNKWMGARMRAWMKARMHACMYACMHVCVRACERACVHACVHTYMHTCMDAWRNAYTKQTPGHPKP